MSPNTKDNLTELQKAYQRKAVELHSIKSSLAYKFIVFFKPDLLSAQSPAQCQTWTSKILSKFFFLLRRLFSPATNSTLGIQIKRPLLGKTVDVSQSSQKNILFLMPEVPGGVMQSHSDLVYGLGEDYQCLTLFAQRNSLRLCKKSSQWGEFETIKSWDLKEAWTFNQPHSKEHSHIYNEIIENFKIDLIHLRHLLTHTLDIFSLAKSKNIPLFYSIHDFYTLCPSINLIDDNGNYCAGICTASLGQCRIEDLWFGDLGILKLGTRNSWLELLREALPTVTQFITTSEYAKNLVVQVMGSSVDPKKFAIIPHGRNFNQKQFSSIPGTSKPLKLFFYGNLNSTKGSSEIKKLYDFDRNNKNILEFHFAGTIDAELAGIGTQHGPYKRDDLEKLFSIIRPCFSGIFSMTGETYCHTLTESWAAGVPVIANNIGSIAERVGKQGGGVLVNITNTASLYDELLKTSSDSALYLQLKNNANINGELSLKEMALSYQNIFQEYLR